MDEEKYNLKWNSHHAIMANTILEHLAHEQLVDVTLSCQGKYIRAHKLILSASSQYFKDLFQIHKIDNPIILIMNVRFDYLQYIIDYIYKGEMKLLHSDIEGILKLANDLQIKGLYGIMNKKFKSTASGKAEKSRQKIDNSSERINIDEETNTPLVFPLADKEVASDTILQGDQHLNTQSNLVNEKKRPKKSNIQENTQSKKRKVQKQNLEKISSTLVDNQIYLSEDSIHQSDSQEVSLQEPEIIIKEDPDTVTAESEIVVIDINESVEEQTKKTVAVKQISAFMLFAEKYRLKVSLEHPDENFKQISLRLSTMWKNLPNEKKDIFYESASRENEKLKNKLQN